VFAILLGLPWTLLPQLWELASDKTNIADTAVVVGAGTLNAALLWWLERISGQFGV
jgi:hypothetical protein